MRLPTRRIVGSAAEWRELCDESVPGAESARIFVVHTRSATAYVNANFDWAKGVRRVLIEHEPDVRDFAALDDSPVAPRLVIGIGGGKALDAAKAVAFWGSAYRSVDELRAVIAAGSPLKQARANLILVPSLASSGSESSRAAIISSDGRKSGLRGEGIMADCLVHDKRLWDSVTAPIAMHYAFDIFAHLVETTFSLRRTPESIMHAGEGFGRLEHWYFELDASLAHYGEAMDAAFHAGICLATSSTCLPHRIQYIIGPVTGTSHVEGIWFLYRRWLALVEKTCPERIGEVAQLLRVGQPARRAFREVFESIHARAAGLVHRERFALLPHMGPRLAAEISGDLAADPAFAGRETLESLITQIP